MSNICDREYKFDNDDSILDSFSKLYEEHNVDYKPRKNTQFIRVKYLLQKMKGNVPTKVYNHFHTSLSLNNKLYHKISTYQDEELTGSSVNNIIINEKDLNDGILRVRYLNNRKLTNSLLKQDYEISKNMVKAIKYGKDLHKLSKNEMKIYHELQKFLNKEQDNNVLIGSYLAGNNSKKLYNKISSILYKKLKNNIISKKEYTKLIIKLVKSNIIWNIFCQVIIMKLKIIVLDIHFKSRVRQFLITLPEFRYQYLKKIIALFNCKYCF